MGKLDIHKGLIIFALLVFAVAPKSVAQRQKQMIYGDWISDKPLYHDIMELSFYSTGKYIEAIRNTRSNKIETKNPGTFKMINDSIIKIRSNSQIFYHK